MAGFAIDPANDGGQSAAGSSGAGAAANGPVPFMAVAQTPSPSAVKLIRMLPDLTFMTSQSLHLPHSPAVQPAGNG